MKQKIMSSEDEIELLKNKLQQQEVTIAQLESSLQSSKTKETEIRTQVSELESRNDCLKKSQAELTDQRAELEKKVQDLEKDLSATQTELELNRKVRLVIIYLHGQYSPTIFNSFPNDTFKTSKLKEFADNYFKFEENGRKFSKKVENSVGKGEISRYEPILLFSQCFQKTYTTD